MQEYPIKRGLTRDLEERVAAELKNGFGIEPEKTGNSYVIRYGALKKLEVICGPGGKTLVVNTESDMRARVRKKKSLLFTKNDRAPSTVSPPATGKNSRRPPLGAGPCPYILPLHYPTGEPLMSSLYGDMHTCFATQSRRSK